MLGHQFSGTVAVVGGARPVGLLVTSVLKTKGVRVIVSEPARVYPEADR